MYAHKRQCEDGRLASYDTERCIEGISGEYPSGGVESEGAHGMAYNGGDCGHRCSDPKALGNT